MSNLNECKAVAREYQTKHQMLTREVFRVVCRVMYNEIHIAN